MNLPPNTDPELVKKFNEIRASIEHSSKICKSAILGPTGNLIWEESDEDYQSRMNELFYEVK